MTNTLNIRYDDTVHAVWSEADGSAPLPLCGDATIPAESPNTTTDPVNCTWCISIME